MSTIHAQFEGFIGEPSTRYTREGTKVVSFSLCVNHVRKTPNGWEPAGEDWVRCSCFGRQADLAEANLNKGDGLRVEGNITAGAYLREGRPQASINCSVTNMAKFLRLPKKETAPEEAPANEWDDSVSPAEQLAIDAQAAEQPAEQPKPKSKKGKGKADVEEDADIPF